ncbi:hypothetical protein MNBD_GAMMA08-2166 [hydrothermal vent metagenome]|uniref:ABC-type transport auxiliary lipoprotein component domain-containing protein n=1 Tax=hydrothermal vent metagenome TaxID=652676 RepID=A0A3B0XAL5_9ZZZZ
MTALLLLSACSPSLLVKQTPPVNRYLLAWNGAPSVSADAYNARGPSIRLGPIIAAAGFDSAQMIYTRKPYQLESYAYHRWVEPPARLLEPLLMRMLEESGLFSAVVGPDTAVRTDLQLDVELLHLQQVFTAEGSEVQLALNVSLVDLARAQLIASQRFSITEPVTEATPYASVQAANRATVRFLLDLRTFLAHHHKTFTTVTSQNELTPQG